LEALLAVVSGKRQPAACCLARGRQWEQDKETEPSYKRKFQESFSIAVGLMFHWDSWTLGLHPSVWSKPEVNDALRLWASSRAVNFHISDGSLGLNQCVQNGQQRVKGSREM